MRTERSPSGTLLRRVTLVAPAVVLVLALIGYFVLVPRQVGEYGRMDSLVVQTPGIAGLNPKPASSSSEPADGGGGAQELTTAAQQSPLETGLWSIDWTPPGKSAGLLSKAQIELFQLPTVAAAKLVRSQENASALSATPYPKYKSTGTFTLPASLSKGDPTSGASFFRAKAKNLPQSWITVLTVEVGRAVALVYLQSPKATAASGTALAERELALLQRAEPGFVLAGTHYPLEESIIWWVVALAVAALVVVTPRLVLAARQRRRAHLEALARTQYRMRGAKVLKRRGAARGSSPGRRPARR